MFTIQYVAVNGESKMQDFDTRDRRKLIKHLADFNRPITAVYEQANVITKAVRKELHDWPGTKTRYADEFVNSLP